MNNNCKTELCKNRELEWPIIYSGQEGDIKIFKKMVTEVAKKNIRITE